MIVLDTNIISELMRGKPAEQVFAWVATQRRSALYIASISQAEILHGIALLPDGKRRADLTAIARSIFAEEFAGHILPFNSKAAEHYAAIVAARRISGNPIGSFDALIAATALANDMGVATRDIKGFENCGLAVINPWLAA